MDRYPVQAQEEHCSRTSWLSPPSRSSKGNFHSVSGCLLAKCAKMDTISKAGVAQSAEQRFCKPQVGGSIPLASSIREPLMQRHGGSIPLASSIREPLMQRH